MNVILPEAVALVQRWETFVATPYLDNGGKLACGYGHSTIGDPVVTPDMVWTEAYASEVLKTDLEKVGRGLGKYITAPLNDYQFGACCSVAYNMGVGGFGRSDCAQQINNTISKYHMERAAVAMSQLAITAQDKVTGVRREFLGLHIRRIVEAAFFLTPVKGV